MPLRSLALDELKIDDEASFKHVAIYHRLKEALRKSEHRFKVAGVGENASWDRVLFLNLTFWSSADDASVLCDDHIAPDEIAHTALHHVVGREVARVSASGAPSPAALLFSEAIASAFDLYLVGRLLPNAPKSESSTSSRTLQPSSLSAASRARRSETR